MKWILMKKFYGRGVEEGMIIFYDSLSEKDRRRYAAIEVQKLPYGGQKYISKDRERNNFLLLGN